ncbi:MAG: VCBS repeat-containing protein, partial [Candidatus Competibacteraceae bacterium]|nr:VCBS repeat-containing protein [Candidatus Competibacteraceae bacterium]
DEALSAADIDGDGDDDLLLGTLWLQQNDDGWLVMTLHDANGAPDRNKLADINRDGRLDAVVGFEAISKAGPLVWYEQGTEVTVPWRKHVIANPEIIGPMSLDVADVNGDGYLDVIAGEHNTAQPETAALYVFYNQDDTGLNWESQLIYMGDEHHDGSQLFDMDNDGDLDIISIGWTHDRVLIYENKGTAALASLSESPMDLPLETATPAVATSETSQISDRVFKGLIVYYPFKKGRVLLLRINLAWYRR